MGTTKVLREGLLGSPEDRSWLPTRNLVLEYEGCQVVLGGNETVPDMGLGVEVSQRRCENGHDLG